MAQLVLLTQSITVLSTPPFSMLTHGRPLFVALTIGNAWEQGLHFVLYPWEVTTTQWVQNYNFLQFDEIFPLPISFFNEFKIYIYISWNRRYITFKIQYKNVFGSIMNILTTFGYLLIHELKMSFQSNIIHEA